MRILSNFDTGLENRLRKDYAAKFGADKVMVVHKSQFFYWRYIGRPLFVWAVLFIIGMYSVLKFEEVPVRGIWVVLGLFMVYGIVIMYRASYKWMDYRLDFLVVTPKEIAKYNQTGVFNRHVEKLHADKIKSITISKPGLFHSLFDIGTLTFLAEGDNDKGDIVMEFVDAVEHTERRIVHSLGLDKAD